MILTATNVITFLRNAELLDAATIVDGNLIVEETHRRNRNFKVWSRHSRNYFVKQVQRWEPEAFDTLRVESECYQFAAREKNPDGFKALLPEYVYYDQSRHILVTRLLENAESLAELLHSAGTIPADAALELGEAFGRYHNMSIETSPEGATPCILTRRIPWILYLHQTPGGNGMQHSAANQQMIQILMRFPGFTAHFDQLARQWRYQCLIHGDVKWDNCMAIHEEGRWQIRMVDWELANWGDPAWDAGCIFAAFLANWIQALPASAAQIPEQFDALSERCLLAMRPSVHAFWNGYCTALRLSGDERRSCLLRCLRYGAARLAQTAYEYLQFSATVDANTYLLLQVSMNILTRPEEAAEELLGL